MTNPGQKRGTLFDSSGNEVAKPEDTLADLNLPPGTQALIEARVNTALDQLREHNRDELERLGREHTRKWKYIALIATGFSIAWGIFTWFVGPEMVKKQADKYVQVHLTDPALKAALSDAAQEIAVKYVDAKFKPLSASADALKNQITSLKTEISTRQETLGKDQAIIQSRVDVQKLAVDAKMGSMSAFIELGGIAKLKSAAGVDAQTYLNDILQYYDAERYNLVQKQTIDLVTRQRLTLSIEEAAVLLESRDSGTRESGANTLSELNKKSSVSLLIGALARENDLRVISRITAALVNITKEPFKPLDKDAVVTWWERNSQTADFQFPADGYRKAVEALAADGSKSAEEFSLEFSEKAAMASVPLFRDVLEKEPAASQAREFLIFALLRIQDVGGARKELDGLQNAQGNFWYLPVMRATVLLSEKKTDAAADAMNEFLEKYPSSVGDVRRFLIFKPLAENSRVKWPRPPPSAIGAKQG